MFKPVASSPDFPQMESELLDYWYRNGIIKKYLAKNTSLPGKKNKKFSFQDGPITANNPMGVHHAWGRTYKDIWQKFFNLLGFEQRFQNGFDCQGLWVEVEVEKELKLKNKKDIENLVPGNSKASIAKFVDLCKQRVLKFAHVQTEQSKRLGYFMDWDNSYYTMSDDNNYMIWFFLKRCFDYGWIYKGKDCVAWCPRCETAISQHEMLTEDYKELTHESVFLKFEILNSRFLSNRQAGEIDLKSKIQNLRSNLLVWTTTPWTIPGNVALAVNPQIEYVSIKHNQEILILAKNRLSATFKQGEYVIIDTFFGKELVGLKYQAAFDDLPKVEVARAKNPDTFHSVVDGINLVSEEEGTGILHVAPGQGKEDFDLSKKNKLSVINLIDDEATYVDGLNELSAKNAKKHPEIIIDYLKKYQDGKYLLKTEKYTHRYPACWRCKTELVWKVTDEWYIAMDTPLNSKFEIQNSKKSNKTFRIMMKENAKKIKWLPEFGLDRELDWLDNMHDWLISKKNRYWGLALPIYECLACQTFEVIGSKEELRQRAVSGWDEFEGKSPHKPYIDDVKIKCSKCNTTVSRIADVGNPWLDAGIVPYSTISKDNQSTPMYLDDKKEWQTWFPADFITESFPGQFKNWFYALIAASTALEDEIPFKTVLGFGTLLGEDGRPMHKSWGNAIEFNEGADKIGVDVMRWMYARQNPADNMLFGYKHADEVRRQFYLMLWNSYRFFIEYALLDKFNERISDVKEITTVLKSENILDKWIINRFIWLLHFSKNNYKKYDVRNVALEIEKFVSDLSTWYIRRSRDRVWINSDNEEDKRAFYKTLNFVLVNLSIVMSPILLFLSDIMYVNLTGEECVHLTVWPRIIEKADTNLIADMVLVREIVEVGHRERKEKQLKVRQILADASVDLPKQKKFLCNNYLEYYLKLLRDELNVKQIAIKYHAKDEFNVLYDTNISEELKKEGEIRDLIRKIQGERKRLTLAPTDYIILTLPDTIEKNKYGEIKKRVMAKEIKTGVELRVEKLSL